MTIRGLHLHFDGTAGAAGDMTLAALIDVGVPESVVRKAFAAMELSPDRLRVSRVSKRGIAAVDVQIDVGDAHGDGQHHHDHYAYADIRQRLAAAPVTDGARERAFDIFDRIARAEAKLHGTTVEDVVFHEVGAIDSIADVVGSAVALDWLSPCSVSAMPMATGRGSVGSAHGRLPVPSPAALAIAMEAGMPVIDGGVDRELLTPTGAAILAHAVQTWGSTPSYTPVAVGYGAGDLDLPSRANVLRATVGRLAASIDGEVVEVAANIDDMQGELRAHVADRLLSQGALDVWWTPIFMKKSRPAYALGVLCRHSDLDDVCRTIFAETTTIGLRYHSVDRKVAERRLVTVATEFGDLVLKEALLRGEVVNVAPEYDACRAVALARGVALKRVYAAALAGYRDTRQATEK